MNIARNRILLRNSLDIMQTFQEWSMNMANGKTVSGDQKDIKAIPYDMAGIPRDIGPKWRRLQGETEQGGIYRNRGGRRAMQCRDAAAFDQQYHTRDS